MPSKDKKTTPAPLYRQLAEMLRDNMESGAIRSNQPLAPERDLATQFGMSRDTVRKAIRLLEDQGLVYSDQGRGTFVAPEAVRQMSRSLDSFSQDTRRRGGRPGQRILLMEQVTAGMAIASLLQVDADATLTRIKRIRLMDDQPIGLQDAYLRLPAGASIERRELERSGSLYRILIDKFGIEPSESLESVGAIAAGQDEAGHLGIACGTPLLVCERVMLSARHEPIEYCEMKYVPAYRYKSRVSKY
jgi:GntR family transcriptional regulator